MQVLLPLCANVTAAVCECVGKYCCYRYSHVKEIILEEGYLLSSSFQQLKLTDF